jgi:DNA-directed RNA polymerase specialized sigma24 family protein
MFGASDVPTVPCHAHFSGATVGVHRSTDFLCVLVALIRTQAERTQRMKIQWKFADGTTSEVEVNEEIGNYITASRREESNLARKERYHCYSLDAIDYEGLEYAIDTTPETDLIREEDAARINTALDKLSETQKRRLLMLADGLSVNEIARIEDVAPNAAWKSIESAKKKFKKHF